MQQEEILQNLHDIHKKFKEITQQLEKLLIGIGERKKPTGKISIASKVFGCEGSEDGQLSYPRGLTIHPENGNIYVCDYYNHRVQIFSPDGKFLFKFGSNHELTEPCAIAINIEDDEVYVGENGNGDRISVFKASTGSFLRHITHPYDTCFMSTICYHSSKKQIFCAFQMYKKVVVFTTSGQIIREFSVSYMPCSLALNESRGELAICFANRAPVMICDLNGKLSRAASDFPDCIFNLCFHPITGDLFMVNSDTHTIQVFDQSGKKIHEFASPEMNKYVPMGVAIHPHSGDLYTTNDNHRVYIINYPI